MTDETKLPFDDLERHTLLGNELLVSLQRAVPQRMGLAIVDDNDASR